MGSRASRRAQIPLLSQPLAGGTRHEVFDPLRAVVVAPAAARKEKAPDALQLQLYEASNRSLEETLRSRDEDIEALRLLRLELDEARDSALRISRGLQAGRDLAAERAPCPSTSISMRYER
jgi:hypothetical protein